MHTKSQQSHPILRRILIPMLLLSLMEVILLAGTFLFGGAIQELDDNARGIVQGKVINRAGYLQNEMISSWSNVSYTVQNINEKAESLAANGDIDLDTIGENSASCYPLTSAISEDLIDMLRSNKVTGAFVIFNNEAPEALREKESFDKPGICLRDLDPDTPPSSRNNDLLIVRGSVDLVHNLDIATDGAWMPQFKFIEDQKETYNLFLNPQEQAYANPNASSLTELGYWSKPYTLTKDNKQVISYTVPLVTSAGKTYGILGMEITLDYLAKALPSEELIEDHSSVYLLMIKKQDTGKYLPVFSSDENIVSSMNDLDVKENKDGNLYFTVKDKSRYYMNLESLKLYDRNGPFESDQWGVAGVVKESDLTEFTRHIISYILVAIFLTIIIGIAGSVIMSLMIIWPIRLVSKHMDQLDPKEKISLPRTKIKEFDQLEYSIENLSSDVIDAATKFTQILNKASILIAGFEIDEAKNALFITDGFFYVLGKDKPVSKNMNIDMFMDEMAALDIYKEEEGDEYAVYKLPYGSKNKFVRLSYSKMEEGRIIGAIEDITRSVQEKLLIEHERDHDLLTGLKNRRAFQRIMLNQFEKGEGVLKKAALVMMDLDNLKHINDKYGHDYGDKYIQLAADSFRKYTPDNTLISRNSGDEFYLFFYGYTTEAEISTLLNKLKEGIDESYILLPSMRRIKLKMSGGISWYPRDSRHYEKLIQYSDFAMYQVKRSHKGEISHFDLGAYHSEEFLSQSRHELTVMLEQEKIEYYYQPIIDARTGEIFAYEALMRGLMPTLRYPSEILPLARKENKLDKIEELTWKIATAGFIKNLKENRIKPGCKAFINSLPDYKPSGQTLRNIETKYSEYLKDFVLEITEESEIDQGILEEKRTLIKRWHSEFALDDYGSGYNGEKLLLQLAPKYIKIDREIVTGIHQNIDKQKILENTLSYAKERDIKVIAEGIELEEEMEKVIELGVDYLQGYYLSKPASEPPQLRKRMSDIIKRLNEEY